MTKIYGLKYTIPGLSSKVNKTDSLDSFRFSKNDAQPFEIRFTG
jgi:hypothetical protein